jgi:hypothetical protein
MSVQQVVSTRIQRVQQKLPGKPDHPSHGKCFFSHTPNLSRPALTQQSQEINLGVYATVELGSRWH